MTTLFDTSAPGSAGPLTASGMIRNFGEEVDFYLSVASNLISNQATGPSVMFLVYGRKTGRTPIQVDYGTTNTTYATKLTGYMVEAVVPAGGSVSCRVVISDQPFPLTVVTVAAIGTVAVSGIVDTDFGQGTQAATNLLTPSLFTNGNKPAGLGFVDLY